ncbi:unnamed protein product [Aphanomyces euteiches]
MLVADVAAFCEAFGSNEINHTYNAPLLLSIAAQSSLHRIKFSPSNIQNLDAMITSHALHRLCSGFEAATFRSDMAWWDHCHLVIDPFIQAASHDDPEPLEEDELLGYLIRRHMHCPTDADFASHRSHLLAFARFDLTLMILCPSIYFDPLKMAALYETLHALAMSDLGDVLLTANIPKSYPDSVTIVAESTPQYGQDDHDMNGSV